MEQPNDDKVRSSSALRVAGIGLGILGATFGVAGWFTLAPAAASTETAVVATGTVTDYPEAVQIRAGSGRVHTRTGGSA